MKSLIIITLAFISGLMSCGQKKTDQSFKLFNEGLSLNLLAIEEQNKGNFEKASTLNKQSLDKFRETLKIDSTHPLVRSALGHSLYVDKQFQEAISWFDKANKFNGNAAINFREMGLCKINLGQIQSGKADIDKAFSMDTSSKIREITIQDLLAIGDLAFSYGDGYIKEGDTKKGQAYKEFSIGTLILAFDYDNVNKNIALKISDYADKLGQKGIAQKYKQLAGQ